VSDFNNRLQLVYIRDEVTGGWRKLHNEELHNLYSSPSIIRMIKSRRMRWAGHAARMGGRGMHIGYWCESQKETSRLPHYLDSRLTHGGEVK
jgi:hypothetical protein